MRIGPDGWAEMETAADDIPAAMYNGMVIARRRQLLQQSVAFKTVEQIKHDEWMARIQNARALGCIHGLGHLMHRFDRVCTVCGCSEREIAAARWK